MAEKVLIASVKDGRTIRIGERIAAHLVARGSHEYVTQAVEPEGKVPRRGRKRTYRRRDMTAEQ